LLELSCACGREGGNGRESLKKSEKVERPPDASFRSELRSQGLKHAMVDSPSHVRALSTVLGSTAAHAPPGSHGLGRSPQAMLAPAVVDHPNL
jgi:hypothetical protein